MPVSAGARHFRSRARPAPYVAAVAVLLVALVLLVRGQVTVEVDVVASRLETPWALAFAADKRLFVTERPGRVRLVTGSGLQAKPVAVLPVTERGESGLLGLALDPRFDENGYLYVCYTTSGRGDRLINRVTRLTFRDGTAGHEVILLDGMPAAGNHDGCRLKFGSDGKLYI